MTPYLVHKTWVDLDHVLAINGWVTGTQCMATQSPFAYAEIYAVFMFCEKPVTISAGELPVRAEWEWSETDLAPAKKTLDAFIAAWKARGQKPAMTEGVRRWSSGGRGGDPTEMPGPRPEAW